jgi:hypothetical protein
LFVAGAVLAGVDNDAIELVEDLRSPMKEIESRLPFRCVLLTVVTDDWRGTRDVVEGEVRLDGCRTFGVAPSSLSMTPNSEKLDGDALVEGANPLVRRAVNIDPDCFVVGEGTPDIRLEILGILVGVSFGTPEAEFNEDEG